MIDPGVSKIITAVALPNRQELLWGIILLTLYTAIALPLGFATGLLKWQPVTSVYLALKISATSLIAPALPEEIVFRVLLFPLPTQDLEELPVVSAIASILVFVIYHPVNALCFFPQGRWLFCKPIFLLLAGLLGLVCTVSYWQSASLWLPVGIHWLAVTVWLTAFGGYSLLYRKDANNLKA